MSVVNVSLIVTVKNDPSGLLRLADKIAQQTKKPFEWILSVAGSENSATYKIAKKIKIPGVSVTILALPTETTRSKGRNECVATATGTLLVFTDVGCDPAIDWLEKITDAFSHPDVRLVSGYTESYASNSFESAQSYFVLVPRNMIRIHPLPATRNLAMRRAVWDQVGPFNPLLNYAEDYEWARRAQNQGYQSTFVSEARVFWHPRKTLYSFTKMIFLLTFGDVHAQTWRRGHILAGLRGVFTFFTIWYVTSNYSIFLATSLAIMPLFLFYMLKTYLLTIQNSSVRAWYIFLHLLTDSAIVGGLISGFISRGVQYIWKRLYV